MNIVNCIALSALDTLDVNGAAIQSDQLVSTSFQPIFNDITSSGTIKIQASNDLNTAGYSQRFVPTNWSDIPNATASITNGLGPMITIPNMAYRYIRVVFTYISGGSSTFTVQMFGFGV